MKEIKDKEKGLGEEKKEKSRVEEKIMKKEKEQAKKEESKGKEKEEKKESEEEKKVEEDVKGKEEEKNEEAVLKENIKQFLKSAELVYETNDFTSAAILYFKSLFAVLDLVILRGLGRVPKDHSERFRILESKYPELYSVLDILYPFYRNTYINKVDKKTCEEVKENVERIIKEQRIFEDN